VERKLVVALAIVGLLFAACGGTTPATQASPTVSATAAAQATATESPTAVIARLYELAKAEKEVQIYSSMNADDGKKVFGKFEEAFPGVKAVHTRASGEVLLTRIVTEKKAGKDLFDVYEANLFEVGYIIEQGYTQKYIVASAGDYPAEVKDASGAFIAARLNNDIPGINTTKLPAGVTIKTWKDLCNPALSGKIAVEQGDVVVYSAMRKILGDAEAQNVLKCIAANKPSIRSGHTDMANLLAAGEFAATLSSNGHRLAQLKSEENKPITWAQTNPIITDVQGLTLANKPPHTNAGKLLMEWLTSTDGQKAVQSTGRVPANPKVPGKYPDLNNFAPIFYVSLALRADFDKDQAFWNSTLGIK
jgi:iron(III) transport system substrate-binding protein